MAPIAALLNLFSIISNEHHELMLISELNKFFNFDHNIFLLDSSADIDQFIVTPQTIYVFKTENGIITGLDSLQGIQSKNAFLIIALERINLAEGQNLTLLTQLKNIQQLQRNIKIGIFSAQRVSSDQLQALFEWCWNNRIINVFVAHRDAVLSIFTYNPFGTFEVINLTGSAKYQDFWLRQNANFQQHPLRVRVTEKVWTSDKNVWYDAVFRVMNASCEEIYRDYNLGPSDWLDNSTIDIEASLYYQNFVSRVKMSPMIMDPVVVVVPEALPYSEFVSFLRKATSSSVIGYLLITFVVIIFLLSLFRYTKLKRILFFQSVADVVNLLLNDNSSIKYQQLSRKEIFLVVPLTFVGFVIVNGILSYLQSYLTRAFTKPQINSIEDIYESPFKIVAPFEIYANISVDVFNNLSNVGDFSNKIVVLDISQYDKEVEMFNTSVSFLMTLSYAQNIVRFQKHLNIRGFHISDLYIYKEIASYNVNDAFPFIPRLNEIIDWVRSAGLYEKWCRDEFIYTENEIRKNLKMFRIVEQTDKTEQFAVPQFILYGWCVSIIVFVFENIFKNLKSIRSPE